MSKIYNTLDGITQEGTGCFESSFIELSKYSGYLLTPCMQFIYSFKPPMKPEGSVWSAPAKAAAGEQVPVVL